jgi:hypothetical protein
LEADPSAQVIVHLVLRADAICNFWIEPIETARRDGVSVQLDLAQSPKLRDVDYP